MFSLVLKNRLKSLGHSLFIQPNIKTMKNIQKDRKNNNFLCTSSSSGSDEGMEMCWSRHVGSLTAKIWPFPSNTSSSCRLTHSTWVCFLFSSVRWAKTAPVACTQQVKTIRARSWKSSVSVLRWASGK